MEQPTIFQILSSAASTEPAPAHTLVPHETKTIEQALGFLRQAIDRTATTWEPILRATPEPISTKTGQGFFTEGDNQSGDWQKRSEEHTSELQSPDHPVCRLLLEKK